MSDNDDLVRNSVIFTKAETGAEGMATFSGRLDKTNGWMTIFFILSTFCLYLCFRKKYVGGIVVTSRRVIHVSLVVNAGGQVIEFEQVNYAVRHFAYEEHSYIQPKYVCCDYCRCIPCVNCILCTPLVPRIQVTLRFLNYVEQPFSVAGSPSADVLEGFLITCCFPCARLGGACMSMGSAGYDGGTISLGMETDMQTGLERMQSMLAAIMFYHPADDVMSGSNEFNYNNPNAQHERLKVMPKSGGSYEVTSEDQAKVILDPFLFGFVAGEKVFDGLPGHIPMCQIYLLAFLTCGVYWCMFMYCADITREFFVLTDRRLIRYVVQTRGFRTLPRLESREGGGSTDFRMEVTSWMMTSIDKYTISEKKNICACFGPECCCCAKAEFFVSISTFFGTFFIISQGKDALRGFLRSLMNQNIEAPLAYTAPLPPRKSVSRNAEGKYEWINAERHDYVRTPTEDIDGVNLMADEEPVAHVEGKLLTCCDKLCAIPLLIVTCCCFPRRQALNLFITTKRMVTSATLTIPCNNKLMESYVEYYALKRITRVRLNNRHKCECCGLCACCPVQTLAVSTDAAFEKSMHGEEVYIVLNVTGTPNNLDSLEERAKYVVSLFSLITSQDGWVYEKRINELPLNQRKTFWDQSLASVAR